MTQDKDGLKEISSTQQSHLFCIDPKVEERILELSLEHPAWGSNRLNDLLIIDGINVDVININKILNRNEMGSRYDRWLKLEQKFSNEPIIFSEEQIKFLEKFNPNFRERNVESSQPGEILGQDTFFIGTVKGIGRVFIHAVTDTFSSYSFCFLYNSRKSIAAIALLHFYVIPFYKERKLNIFAIHTDNGREFCGEDTHPYGRYLERNNIKHHKEKVRKSQTNGFVERFNGIVLDEFFRTTFRTKFYGTIAELQNDLDEWLVHYNCKRANLGYRNMGKKPIDPINEYLRSLEH